MIIGGHSLPVGIEGVECLDQRYLKMKELEQEIEREENLQAFKSAQHIYHVVGPRGGHRAIYLKQADQPYLTQFCGPKQCEKMLALIKEAQLAYEEISQEELYKLR